MLFNSIEFLFFLPIVFALYWSLQNHLRWQIFFVVVVSYVFYGWWNWRFLMLIALTSFCSYASGVGIERLQKGVRKCKRLAKMGVISSNIILNLAILGFFKYYNFFVDSFVDMFSLLGIALHPATLQIILPVGISFYTFQALSYSIDVYKQKLPATTDVVSFFAYVSFFPQLVAGPIERATNLLPQFYKPRTFDYSSVVDGCRQMLWGFFKKIVVADNCAKAADQIFNDYSQFDGSVLLVGAVFFTFQIYADFSGYSDIAIGCAKLFGINLMQNFNIPYFSRDIAEFWRRWHISLTTWFRDYIYIPLGGSRCSKAKIIRNTFIIFLVSGFWHGANWTFVGWGAYHACLFLPLVLLGKNRKNLNVVAENRLLPTVKEFLQMLLTFSLVVIGWVLFRSETIGDAWNYCSHMISSDLWRASYRFFLFPKNSVAYMVLLMMLVEWVQRNKKHGLDVLAIKSGAIRIGIYYVIILLMVCYFSSSDQFLYFQF